MLLRDFKKVSELDSKIDTLHLQLKDLYDQRAAYAAVEGSVSTKGISREVFTQSDIAVDWVDYEYSRLRDQWALYAIQIPAFTTLKKRLEKARSFIQETCQPQSELRDSMSIVLVPPINVLQISELSELRAIQGFSDRSDIFDTNINVAAQDKKWRVIVAYNKLDGLILGSAADILSNDLHVLDGTDMRALGVYEYIALSLQHPSPLDVNGWTVLLKDYLAGDVVSVSFIGGLYRFVLDDAKGIGTEYFRPAKEIS